MKPFSDCRLYAFIDMAYLHGREPDVLAKQLCEGGADLIQLRAKGIPPDQIRRWAEQILPITRAAEVGLVINDYPEVAWQTGAECCHLGQEDFTSTGYRRVSQMKPPSRELRFGLSTHAPIQALRAVAAKPDYLAIGPVYATSTKPSATPVTLDYVRWAASHLSLPWFAIGGITLENLEEVLAAGAERICVLSAILNAPDAIAACQAFRKRLG